MGAVSRFRKGFALLCGNGFCLLLDPEAGQVGEGAPLRYALLEHQVVDGLGNGDGDARDVAAAGLLSHLGLCSERWLVCHGEPVFLNLYQSAAESCHLRSLGLGSLSPRWCFDAIQVPSFKRRCGPLPPGEGHWLGLGNFSITLKSW